MKRSFLAPLLALSVLAGAAQLANGQQRDWVRVDALLFRTNVPKELALSEEQTAQLRAAENEIRKQARSEGSLGITAEELAKVMVVTVKVENREFEKAITRILKPEQLKRLKQIYFQDRGPWALEMPEVAEALQLRPEQKEKVQTLNTQARKAEVEVLNDPRPASAEKTAERREKLAELHKQAKENVLGVLDAQQKKVWREFIGEPFEVKRESLRGPGPPT